MKAKKAHQKAGNANWPGLNLHWALTQRHTHPDTFHTSFLWGVGPSRQAPVPTSWGVPEPRISRHLKASQGTPQITTGLTKERKHGWMMLNDAEWCWMVLNGAEWCWMFRTEEVTIATWSSAESEKRSAWSRLLEPCQNLQKQTDAEVLLKTPNCSRLKKTAWDRFCHQMYAWQSSSFSTKRWDWSWMMSLSDLEWSWVILSDVRWLLFLWLFSFRTRLRRNRVAPNAKVVLCASHSWKESERRTRRTVATL